MDATDFTMTSEDNEQVFVYRWSGDGEPRAIVQIAHGMGEHAARYARLAAALVDARLRRLRQRPPRPRPHRRLAGPPRRPRRGRLGRARRRHRPCSAPAPAPSTRDIPLVLLGHSMGSFALQQYLLDHSADLDAAVLSGTSAVDVIAAGHRPVAAGRPDGVQRPVRAGPHRLRLAQPRRRRGRRVRRRPGVRVRRSTSRGMAGMLAGAPAIGRPRPARRASVPTCRSTCSPATPTRSPAAARWSSSSASATATPASRT